MKVAFLGLGVMGFPMAGHLSRGGHDVVVYNRSPEKAESWLATFAGRAEATPAAAAADRDVVLSCVGNDDDLREVMYGSNGVLAGAGAGTVLVDHTTTSARVAREVAGRAGEHAMAFIDAPVSGGEAGAVNGKLTVMAGGNAHDLDRVRPVLECYARSITRIGEVGAGQQAKMVNQVCIAGILQGLAEGLDLALRAGLDPEAVIAAISGGAAQSWQMENRWQTMVDGQFDFGFAVDWMRKDLGIALEEGERLGASLALARRIDAYYAEVQAMGGARWDTSSLIARLRE